MTLKERVLKRKRTITKEDLEAYRKSPEAQRYDMFLKICERLQNNVNLDEICCGTYQEVINEIEKRNIDISDIVSRDEYQTFKKELLNEKAQWCPHIGKEPDKIYDFNKEGDRLEFLHKHKGIQF